jgi:hypothetical protein
VKKTKKMSFILKGEQKRKRDFFGPRNTARDSARARESERGAAKSSHQVPFRVLKYVNVGT